MTARLLAAGVEVDLRVYPALPHAFTGHATSTAKVALEMTNEWLRRQIGETTEVAAMHRCDRAVQ